MQIIIAPYSGFCFGVKMAIKEGEEQLTQGGLIASYGPLIHNPQEVNRLEKEGIICRENLNDIKEEKVLIRTHGVTPLVLDKLQEKNFQIIDCTCPFVKKVQKIANEYADKGYTVLIFGNKKHPEVEGIVGWSRGKGIPVRDLDDLQQYDLSNKKICLVAQTTENNDTFNTICGFLENNFSDLVAFNTICSATSQRQKAALTIAQDVDLMIVVGGLNSANTQKLALLCEKSGTPTKHIETSADLDASWFDNIRRVGVTAGASTPDWIIEEVVRTMEEIKNKGEMHKEAGTDIKSQFEEDMPILGTVTPGEIITGKVVQINSEEIMVDVGGKSEGLIPIDELSYRKVNNPHDFVKIGDEVKVEVLKVENAEGNMVLSKRRADQEQALQKLEEAFNQGTAVEAEVVEKVKGGVLVDIGMRGFVPASLIDRVFVENLDQFVGQKLQFKVIEFDRESKKAVLSRKAVLEEEYQVKKAQILDEISPGQKRKGIVQRITNFGAFIDLGGVDGLLHVSEMGWGRVSHPRDIVKEGDEIEVYILNVDKENEKISLGLKQLIPSPWEAVASKYPAGTIVSGKVARIAPFGVFVEIEPGIDGLVHISQLSWERVEKPEDVVSVGQEVKVKVLDVNKDEKKMSLSIKEVMDKPVKEKKEVEKKEAYPEYQDEPSGVTIGDVVGNLFDNYKNRE
ncbi:MAG: bifunctional 4-hydroxy-3-methylbut-2-enyl diphosphate reductase/30S ribosomal protein S1 [Bacillota bacterium]